MGGKEWCCCMAKCEICGDKVEEVSKCKECSTKFCNDCGEPIEELCEYCYEETDW